MKFCMEILMLIVAGGHVYGELRSHQQPHQRHIFTNFDLHSSYDNQQFSERCGEAEVRGVDGRCVRAKITRNFYVFNAPPTPKIPVGPPPYLPDPKVHYNFVFIRSPQTIGSSQPIVLPAPHQKTLVYVLSKRPGVAGQEVIEVSSEPIPPEVFFVNYSPGDDTHLPGGISLQEALGRPALHGDTIDTGDGRHGKNRVGHNNVEELNNQNREDERQGFEQIYRENVEFLSGSSFSRPRRPIPHHVFSGSEESNVGVIRPPAPIEILPPAF
ncbi:protein of unknown function DUF243 [Trinorchestia longiramus]|nr:protein of unknown function DUF243 [Trinorchestia longiramus]